MQHHFKFFLSILALLLLNSSCKSTKDCPYTVDEYLEITNSSHKNLNFALKDSINFKRYTDNRLYDSIKVDSNKYVKIKLGTTTMRSAIGIDGFCNSFVIASIKFEDQKVKYDTSCNYNAEKPYLRNDSINFFKDFSTEIIEHKGSKKKDCATYDYIYKYTVTDKDYLEAQ